MQHLKNYFSIVLLLIFLFPIIEKDVHDIEHKNDFHCGAVEKHFHSAEHHCPICNFIFTSSEGPAKAETKIIVFCASFSYAASINSVYELNRIDNSGSRAPPTA